MTPKELEKLVDLVGLKTLVLGGISVNDLLTDTREVNFETEDDRVAFYNEYGFVDSQNDLPAIIRTNGTKIWYKNGKIHRENDKPAAILINGTKVWYKNGEIHRDGNKPALISANGTKEWYKNGKIIKRVPAVGFY